MSMHFKAVADVFEQISNVSSRTTITQLLADLLRTATDQEANILCNLSLGELRPAYLGNQFNIGKKQLIKVVAQLVGKSMHEIEVQTKNRGDLGLVVADYQWPSQGALTVQQVYAKLSDLAEISGEGAHEDKQQAVLALLQSVDSLSAKYIIRMMLGTLRLGFSDMTILDALSWMAVGDKSLKNRLENAYNVCADIGLIAQTLKAEGIDGIDAMRIKVGVPIRLAAAERLPTAKAIFEKLGPCVAQPKLDGFRLEIHIDKHDPHKPIIKFFSRNLIDMSYMFPDLLESLLKLDVTSLVCEGEAIVYDPHTGSFLPFQETVKRKRKHGIEEAISEYPLQLHLFDLLYLNGESYLDKTEQQRRGMLLKLFDNFPDLSVQVIKEEQFDSAQELENYFLKNIGAGLEGIVVKKPDSIYQPGQPKKANNYYQLIKLKLT